MPAQIDLGKLSVRQFAERFRGEMIPLSNTFSYFCASVPMSEEDLREYLQEPVAALPPKIAQALPKISILLVPYLERANGSERGREKSFSSDYVSIEKPPEGRLATSTQVQLGEETFLAFALKDQEVAEYHYRHTTKFCCANDTCPIPGRVTSPCEQENAGVAGWSSANQSRIPWINDGASDRPAMIVAVCGHIRLVRS